MHFCSFHRFFPKTDQSCECHCWTHSHCCGCIFRCVLQLIEEPTVSLVVWLTEVFMNGPVIDIVLWSLDMSLSRAWLTVVLMFLCGFKWCSTVSWLSTVFGVGSTFIPHMKVTFIILKFLYNSHTFVIWYLIIFHWSWRADIVL